MPGRPPQAMRQRDERAHAVVQHAIDTVGIDTDIPYTKVTGIPHANANEARLSIGRAGEHLGVVTKRAWVVDQRGKQCFEDCQDPQAPHGVVFYVHSHESTRAHIAAQANGDPANLKYNPFEKRKGPRYDDFGQPI